MKLVRMVRKNESIYLWMLQQERQKNRTLMIEQTIPNRAAHSSSIPDNILFESEKSSKDEDKPQTPSETTDLDQLAKEAAALEEESRHLEEQEKQLNLRAKTLCENAIQELKKKKNEKQKEVNQLKERIGNLETQLRNLSSSGPQHGSGVGKIENPNQPASKSHQNKALPSHKDGTAVGFTEEVSKILRASSIVTQ